MPTFHATRAVPSVLVSEKPADGIELRIEIDPECFSTAASVTARARQAASCAQPSIREITPLALPCASVATSAVIAERSAPSTLKTRASRALIDEK